MSDAIREIRKIYEDKLLKLKNVVGVGVGNKIVGDVETNRMCIRVYVEKKELPYEMHNSQLIPRTLDVVETDVIEIGKVRALEYTKRMRPAKCGISIGHHKITAGTLGCLVKDRNTEEILILSNSHVLAQSGKASFGDAILQPGKHDGGTSDDVIAFLLRSVKIKYRSWWMAFFFWIKDSINRVDCAVAMPLEDNDVLSDIMEIGVPKGVANANVGMEVQKTGRTTGYTKGKVIDADMTVSVDYGDFVAKFEHQIMFSAMSAGGDSGSAILTMDKKVISLLFAGSEKVTIGNPINEVLQLLNVDIVT